MAPSFRPLMARAGVRSYPRSFLGRKSSSPYALALLMLLTLSLVLLLLLALGIFSLPVRSDSAPNSGVDSHPDRSLLDVESLGNRGHQWTEVISWEPRAFVYHNFLSKEECEYLIELAKPHMQKSAVVDSTTGKSKDSRVRTSTGMFLQRGQDEIIRAIEKRIAYYTFIPVEHGEGLQVLHYEVGQKYEPHFDYFLDEYNTRNGGQRMATLLMYLSDVEEGGETIFPNAIVRRLQRFRVRVLRFGNFLASSTAKARFRNLNPVTDRSFCCLGILFLCPSHAAKSPNISPRGNQRYAPETLILSLLNRNPKLRWSLSTTRTLSIARII